MALVAGERKPPHVADIHLTTSRGLILNLDHSRIAAKRCHFPTDWQEEAARQSNDGGSSQGFGYTARALLERRVTSNWFVGTAIDIQQAKDYAPSHFLLYVRYSAAGWQGDMDLPPQPLIPYADW